MFLNSKRKMILYSIFLVLLVVDLLFFMIVRADFPSIYSGTLDNILTFVGVLGFTTYIETVEAFTIIMGFVTAIISSCILFLMGIRELKTRYQ